MLQYYVDVGDAQPFQQRSYRFSSAENDIIDQYVDERLDADILEKSLSLF
jgi:hypothetical protein